MTRLCQDSATGLFPPDQVSRAIILISEEEMLHEIMEEEAVPADSRLESKSWVVLNQATYPQVVAGVVYFIGLSGVFLAPEPKVPSDVTMPFKACMSMMIVGTLAIIITNLWPHSSS